VHISKTHLQETDRLIELYRHGDLAQVFSYGRLHCAVQISITGEYRAQPPKTRIALWSCNGQSLAQLRVDLVKGGCGD
jgi:hypothetical protein